MLWGYTYMFRMKPMLLLIYLPSSSYTSVPLPFSLPVIHASILCSPYLCLPPVSSDLSFPTCISSPILAPHVLDCYPLAQYTANDSTMNIRLSCCRQSRCHRVLRWVHERASQIKWLACLGSLTCRPFSGASACRLERFAFILSHC